MNWRTSQPLAQTSVGVGLRAPHIREITERSPTLGFLEVHSENYFGQGGADIEALRRLRADYPVSAHGVGLSLGSGTPVARTHLERLAELVEWLEPALISEHLSWGAVDGRHLNDLLPLPYTFEVLAHMVRAVDVVQTRLKRRILIENVSSYVVLPGSDMHEWEFLAALASASGCGLLLDVNNVYVNACNHGFDPIAHIDALPILAIEEIHVAGHSTQQFEGVDILVDTHDSMVAPPVWDLLRHALCRYGPRPVLVEWDCDLPPVAVLEQQAAIATVCLKDDRVHAA